MASEQAILNMMGRALWDPNPTAGSDLRARQLAAALGYPKTWRVVRTIEDHAVAAPVAPVVVAAPLSNNNDDKGDDKGNAMEAAARSTDAKKMNEEEKAVAAADTTTTTTTTSDKAVTMMEAKDDQAEETDAASKNATSDKVVTMMEAKDDKAKETDAASKNDGGCAKDPKINHDSSSIDVDDSKKEDVTDKMDIDHEPTAAKTVAEKEGSDTNTAQDDKSKAAPESAQVMSSSSSNDLADKMEVDKNEEIDKETQVTKPMTAEKDNASSKDVAPPKAAPEDAKMDVTAGKDTTCSASAEQKTGKEAKTEAKVNDVDESNEKKVPVTSASKEPTATSVETNHHEKVPAIINSSSIAAATTKKTIAKRVIVDRIYAGKPGTDCDMWFNHYAAMQAAQQWDEIINNSISNESSTTTTVVVQLPSPFHFKGGHLLPRVSKFEKNDKVEVFFENKWWDAKILRKKEHAVDGFRYQVHYDVDSSKQSGVDESLIRHRRAQKDPHHVAALLGFDAGWQAVSTGHNRWKITSPSGVTYPSKKAALQAAKEEVTKAAEVGDPPWRTTGHDYIGRTVLYTQEHAVSARRKITVEQTGKVVGWISASDVDKAGEPGFVSETTGKPANLFHVEFDDTISPQNHPYPSYLVQSQDLEEFEVEACLIPDRKEDDDVSPSKKKARKR